jgi:uncharacterized protein (DUF1697 family)
MPKLRELLEEAGFDDVSTYIRSGNVVLSSTSSAKRVASRCEGVIADGFGLDIAVVVRTRAELEKVVGRNPLAKVAEDPKRYQVSFLADRPPRGLAGKLEAAADERESFAIHGREIYAWHPHGVARSKLWALLAGKQLGVTATSRNWTTVTKLLELARDEES